LVGGRTGQLISNQIAFHVQTSLNWGLAAALGSILLAIVVAMTLLLSRVTQQGVLQR
jgi:putative spermidine/putrescine transport system permease protein